MWENIGYAKVVTTDKVTFTMNEKLKYFIVLDKNGFRKTSFVLDIHAHSIEELKAKAAEDYPCCSYLIATSELQAQLAEPDVVYCDGQVFRKPSKEYSWNGSKWVLDQALVVEIKKQGQDQAWENIKAERYRRAHGGVWLKSNGKWLHTDEPSRIQYLSLQQMYQLPELNWKSMDGTFFKMTKEILNELMMTMLQNEQADFANAERHRLAMLEVDEPLSYDYSTGWSEIYE